MPTISANGLDFAYLEAGPSDGPLALCLHGFPDAAPTWNPLLAALGDAGFHAVAPWLRGYAPTSIPSDGLYGVGLLEQDANALHEALGGDERAVIIGHDWGAIATYGIAVAAPDRWRRVVGSDVASAQPKWFAQSAGVVVHAVPLQTPVILPFEHDGEHATHVGPQKGLLLHCVHIVEPSPGQ